MIHLLGILLDIHLCYNFFNYHFKFRKNLKLTTEFSLPTTKFIPSTNPEATPKYEKYINQVVYTKRFFF